MARIQNDKYEERVLIPFAHPQVTATTTWKFWKCPVGATFVIDRVLYINPTGLVADATNAFRGEIKKGATLMADVFNTDSNDVPAGAALTANTFFEGTVTSTAANKWLVAGDELSLVATLEGTQTLPAGHLVIEGRLVK